MKSRSIGLQMKLILLGLALVIIPLLVSTLTNLHFARSTKDQIQAHQSESLDQSALDYLQVLAQRDQVVTQLPERGMATFTLEQFASPAPPGPPAEPDVPPSSGEPSRGNAPHI